MFHNEFYPTPRNVVEKMLKPLKENNLLKGNILEPSAGKGDIADAIQEHVENYWGRTKADIYCVEIVPELQSILRDKGYKIAGSDFLKYFAQGMYFDIIIMNPPFSNGVDHILHAWELLWNGHLVALLPKTVLKESVSWKRDRLLQIIEEHGTVEKIGAAFRTAEKTTKVDCIIVRLERHRSDDTLDVLKGLKGNMSSASIGAHKAKESPIINESQLVVRDTVKQFVEMYNATLSSFPESLKALRQLSYYGGCFDRNCYNEDTRKSGVMDVFTSTAKTLLERVGEKDFESHYYQAVTKFTNEIRRAAWKTVFEKTRLAPLMTQGVQREFDSLCRTQSNIEFTEDNIYNMIETVLSNTDTILEQAVLEAFDKMTSYHYENRVHFEGWKTNDCWRVNRKFILPFMVENWVGNLHIHYQASQDLDDIDRALCLLSGKKYNEIMRTSKVIDEGCRNREKNGVSEFFEIKWYKKGTAHFKFRDMTLWQDFNVMACRGKNWLPPGCEKNDAKKVIGLLEG